MPDNNTNLPHQEDEIKPEGIIDHEQDPPEVSVVPDDYADIPKDKRVISTTLQNDDKNLQKFLEENKPMTIAPPPPAKRQETHLLDLSKEKQTTSTSSGQVKKPGKFALLFKKLFSK